MKDEEVHASPSSSDSSFSLHPSSFGLHPSAFSLEVNMPPTMLLDALEGIRRRVKFFGVAYGVGVVLAAAVGLLLAVVLLDFALNLTPAPRAVVMLCALGGIGVAVYHFVVRPARARLGIGDIAGRVENVYPQFEDRLRSTVDFVREGGSSIPGSEPMKRATIDEATRRAEGIDFARVVNPAPAWYSAGAAAGAIVLLLALGFLLPSEYVDAAWARLGMGAEPWPKTVEIGMLQAVPARVPVGQRVDVRMKLNKGDKADRKAVIYYRYDNGPWQQELMKRGADGAYASALDARLDAARTAGTLEIKMVAGDDTKVLPAVQIVPRLDISRIVANVTAPEYAGHAKTSVNLAERAAVMPVGAGVELRVEFNKPLDPASRVALVMAEPGDGGPDVKWDLSGGSVASGTFEAGQSFRFSVGAKDQDGFENSAAQQYELIVREDGMPSVQIEEPRRSEERTPTATFPLRAVAEDDFGIGVAQLVVQRIGQASSPSPAAPAAADAAPAADPAAGPPAPPPDPAAAAAAQPAPPAPAPAPPAVGAENRWVIPLLENTAAGEGVSWEQTGATSDRQRYRLDYTWDLGKLANANLKPGDVLEYFVQVKDNFRLNGREHEFVPSGKLRITIISPEQWARAVQAEVEQIGQELRQVKQGQARTKVETGELAKAATERAKFDEADKAAAERLANQQGTTAAQTMQTAQKLENLVRRMAENKSPEAGVKQTAQEVADRLEKVTEAEMREAGKHLNEAKDGKVPPPDASADQQKQDAERRAAELNKAAERQADSEARLDEAMKKLGDFSTIGDTIQNIEAIKAEQERIGKEFAEAAKKNLGKTAEQLDKGDREKNEDLAKQQDALQERTQKALAEMEKKGDDLKKSDAAKSKAMKEASQAGQQVPQQQQKNAQAMQQNQQAQQQQAQKQVELGLEMILQKLKDAERRELEELQKQLAELEQLVAQLIKRQAGHNLDNLTLDNPKRLQEMTEADRDALMAQAERDEANMPAPPAQNELSPAQETTERNTRDVAKTAEALPNPAPASKLTAAAGHMERAIVHLRAAKLGEAYDPPQVESLRALDEAMQIVQEELRKAEEQLEEQDKETVRQAYVKLLEDQKKLDAETKEIEAKRDPAGNLPREVAVRVGQLPGVQGGLAERTNKLGADLKTLKSIVYDWANREIAKSMEGVQQQLARPDTGAVTQAEQTKIEEQIQALIDNLKTTPPEQKKFADRQQGGGGGEGSPPPPTMPTEAELRLLKQFQQAVNKSTEATDAAGKKDAQETLALGGRQGELRNLLDELIKQATQGKVDLGPEPDNKDQLPEEATEEDVDDEELDDELLGDGEDEPEADAVVEKVRKTGARMARSRQRLALNNDAGKVTQIIQKRIVFDLDELIKESQRQQQQQQASGKQKSKPGQQQQPNPGEQKGQQTARQPGQTPGQPQGERNPNAMESDPDNLDGGPKEEDLSKDIRETAENWGKLFQRDRGAQMEGGDQQPVRKYKEFIDDYYRSLSEKGSQR
jgi:hypothetical protein